jgi:hypothetical protein
MRWSLRLLDEPERALFERLGVFAGNPTAQAVHTVCGVDADCARTTSSRLDAMTDDCLISRNICPTREPRWSMLQTRDASFPWPTSCARISARHDRPAGHDRRMQDPVIVPCA